MSTVPAAANFMPDVAERPHHSPQGTLDWVGMSDIHQSIVISGGGRDQRLPANVQVYVNLEDPRAKGIHMSRLYLLLDEHARHRPLSAASVTDLLNALQGSHADLSSRAFVEFTFGYERRQTALVSEHAGWHVYPASLKGTLENGQVTIELGVQVTYSSTCPCSAALARQLIQQQFERSFRAGQPLAFDDIREWLGTEEAISATPHSQRSFANVKTRLAPDTANLPIDGLIDNLEAALGTPVQTAVKRADEQEFARLNGSNLMFCEDAGRKLQTALNQDDRFDDFWVRVEHHESLHPHNAVTVFSKGVAGGYLPIP